MDSKKENEILTKKDKFVKFLSGDKLFWIILVIFIIFVGYVSYTFINGTGNTKPPSITSNDKYISEEDGLVMENIQDLTNTRMSFLADINDIISRKDLNKDEKIDFIKDVKATMQDNSKAFNDTVNKLNKISKDPKDDISRMNKINYLSLKYADYSLHYLNDPNKEKSEELFKVNSDLQKNFSKMKYSSGNNQDKYKDIKKVEHPK